MNVGTAGNRYGGDDRGGDRGGCASVGRVGAGVVVRTRALLPVLVTVLVLVPEVAHAEGLRWGLAAFAWTLSAILVTAATLGGATPLAIASMISIGAHTGAIALYWDETEDPPSEGTRYLNVNLDPQSRPIAAPEGWTENGLSPLPPETATGGAAYAGQGSAGGYSVFSSAAAGCEGPFADPASAVLTCAAASAGDVGEPFSHCGTPDAPNSVLCFYGGGNTTKRMDLNKDACPAGYTWTALETCTLSDPVAAQMPPDGQCDVIKLGGVFMANPRDPDCANTGNWSGFGTEELTAVGPDYHVSLSTSESGGTIARWQKYDVVTDQTTSIWTVWDADNKVTGQTVGVGDGNLVGTPHGSPGGGGGGGPGSSVTVETCGRPGQPPCKIDETGTPTTVTQPGNFGAGHAKLDEEYAKLELRNFDPETDQIAAPDWLPSLIGGGECVEPISWVWMGNEMPLQLCEWYAPFRTALAWVLWAWLAVFAWKRLVKLSEV